jgi:hypothetical protein
MKPHQLFSAIEVLGELAANFGAMPEEREKAAEAWLTIADAALYVTELAHHLVEGKEPYDALLSTVRGEMLIPTRRCPLITLCDGSTAS